LIQFIKIDVNHSRRETPRSKGEMMMQSGLDDVIAAETVLSDVDGAAGRLVLRGATLDDLGGASFETVLERLAADFCSLPTGGELAAALRRARVEVAQALVELPAQLLRLEPLDAMRALLAQLGDGVDAATALRLVAAPAVFTPALIRTRRGQRPLAPDAGLSHASDVLRMLHGRCPDQTMVAALDAYLVTVSDHGLNASTFVARIVASTGAGLTSSVLAALGALKGPLHGGAPGPVLDMLDAVDRADAAEAWLAGALGRGERLMGFGHRVYRVRDPRADALRKALAALRQAGLLDPARMALAEAVEAAALALLQARKPDRALKTNVEFYTALLLEALGFPRDAFTCVFAMGRMAGWIAHAREQGVTGRLIRPQSRYVGPLPRNAA
jgi:citrate synthase